MIANQKKHGRALARIHIQPVQAAASDFQAGLDVIATRHALPCVMQQEGEVEQLRIFQLAEELGIPLIPFRWRLAQAMQALNRDKRMLVYREPMIKVAHHQ